MSGERDKTTEVDLNHLYFKEELSANNLTVFNEKSSPSSSSSTSLRQLEGEVNMEDGRIDKKSSSSSGEDMGGKYRWWEFEGNTDAQAMILDQIGTAPIVGGFFLLTVAILDIVEDEVGCGDLDDEMECEGTAWGLKPSSVMTTCLGLTGIIGSLLMPIFGAITDYTTHRRKFGYASAVIIALCVAVQCSISHDTWELCAVAQMVILVTFFFHGSVRLAYMPSVTDDKDVLVDIVAKVDATKYSTNLFYLMFVLVMCTILSLDNIETARLGLITTFFTWSIFMHLAWTKFRDVPALQEKEIGVSYLSAGFKKLSRTRHEVFVYNRPLMWIFIMCMIGNSCIASFVTVGSTISVDYMDFDSLYVLLANTMFTISAVPGSLLGKYVSSKKNVLYSIRFFLVWVFLTSIVFYATVTGSDSIAEFYIYILLFGMGSGGYYASETALVSMLVPLDKEAELMGTYVFCTRIFIWIPPTIYTILNERGVPVKTIVIVIESLALLALVMTLGIGNYQNALDAAEKHKNKREVVADSNGDQ